MASESNPDFAHALKVLTARIDDVERCNELITAHVIADVWLKVQAGIRLEPHATNVRKFVAFIRGNYNVANDELFNTMVEFWVGAQLGSDAEQVTNSAEALPRRLHNAIRLSQQERLRAA